MYYVRVPTDTRRPNHVIFLKQNKLNSNLRRCSSRTCINQAHLTAVAVVPRVPPYCIWHQTCTTFTVLPVIPWYQASGTDLDQVGQHPVYPVSFTLTSQHLAYLNTILVALVLFSGIFLQSLPPQWYQKLATRSM